MTASADSHLLFGLLALQNGLIDQGQLVAAFQAWTRNKARSLADHLEARGDLTGARRAALEVLAAVHIETHGGDVEKSLAAVPANRSTRATWRSWASPRSMRRSPGSHGARTDRPPSSMTTSTAPPVCPSARPPAMASGFTCFGLTRGGLGEVFVALDAELHREVALKQILEKHADDAVSRQRFVAEAEITGGLEHPGVVPVYGLGTYGGGRPLLRHAVHQGRELQGSHHALPRRSRRQDQPGSPILAIRNLN